MEIKVASDFSTAPGPRRRTEGRFSGEEFRETLLAPRMQAAVAANEQLTVDLDGTAGYGTSFLEEAFGGLIRNDGFTLAQLRALLYVKSDEEPDLIAEVNEYIDDASKDRPE